MKHKKFTTRVELLRAAADSIEMQEQAGVEPVWKYCKGIDTKHYDFSGCISDYEFPLAFVEGKQVWEGDELYFDHCTLPLKVVGYRQQGNELVGEDGYWRPANCASWNPPKPKTVMVELRGEVAEYLATRECDPMSASEEVTLACRKALEELNYGKS